MFPVNTRNYTPAVETGTASFELTVPMHYSSKNTHDLGIIIYIDRQ